VSFSNGTIFALGLSSFTAPTCRNFRQVAKVKKIDRKGYFCLTFSNGTIFALSHFEHILYERIVIKLMSFLLNYMHRKRLGV